VAGVLSDRRPRDTYVICRDRDEVRVVARRPPFLLDNVDAPIGCDDRGVDVVDRLVGVTLEGAVQRASSPSPR